MEDAAHTVPVETLLSHRGWVRALAWSLVRDAHLVDEVEQETWLRALRSPPREKAAARGWLGVVVRNVVRNRFRTESRRAVHEDAAPPRTASPAAADVVARADAQQAVVRAVMALEEPYRTTLLLRFFDDLPPREVAARMDVPVETVRTRTRRALARVRDVVSEAAGGRRAAFGLLAPLLAEGPPPVPAAATSTAAASSLAATTGALIMAATTKKLLAITAVLLLAGIGAVWMVQPESAPETAAVEGAVPTEAGDAADRATMEPERRRVRSEIPAAETPRDVGDEAAPTLTRIRVLLPDGQPAQRLRRESALAETSPARLVGGTGGVLEIAGEGWADLTLSVPGRPAHEKRVRLGAGDVDVRLPDGGVVEGVVRVDGAPPTEPIVLRLSSTALSGTGPALETDAAGRFRFAGLRGVDEARLVIDERGHDFVGGDGPFLDVAVPSRGLVLDLLARPRTWGRVVMSDGAPVPGARLELDWSGPHGNGSLHRVVGDDGRFDLALPGHEFTSLELTVSSPGGVAATTVTPRSRPAPGGALGDVVLPPIREVLVQVVDRAGEPVAGASTLVESAASTADADGRAVVRVSGATPVVHVGAIGFEATTRELTQGLAEPVRIELASAASVVLAVHPAEHGVPSLRVRVLARGTPMFAGEHGAYPSDVDRAAGASSPEGWRTATLPDGTHATIGWFSPDAGGRVVLNGVHPEREFEAALIDAMGAVHDRVTVRPAAGTDAPRILRVAVSLRHVGGVVRDARGAPVRAARVKVAAASSAGSGTANGPGVVTWTDDEGRFRVPRVCSEAVDVLVTTRSGRDGRAHVPWSRGGLATDRAGDLDVRLETGTTVRLRITDAAGLPVVADLAFADVDVPFDGNAFLWSLDPVEGAAGTYAVSGLPKDGGAVTVEIHVEDDRGTAVHRVEIDPAAGDRDVVLGAPAHRENYEAE